MESQRARATPETTYLPGKEVDIIPGSHSHLDVGFTDYQATVAAIQSRIIDQALDSITQHPDFCFSIDGEWNLEQFLKTRTPAERQRVITAIQQQHLFVPAQYANLLTGFPTAETLVRSLYPSADFSFEHNTPFNYANITDVPSYSWSYASILASADLKYFLAGSNGDRAPVLNQGHLNDMSPVWWEGPDGKKVLFWNARGYGQTNPLFGQPTLVSSGHDMLPLFLKQYEHPSYHANAAIIFGTQGENTDLRPAQTTLVRHWNSIYAYPRLQYSGVQEAMENIAQQFGDSIPVMRGDGGPYWEDGIASDAFYAAMERANESRAPSAEKLATLSSLLNPHLSPAKADLDQMWREMVLMDEHTWGSSDSVSDPTGMEATQQLSVKDAYALHAHELVSRLVRNSVENLLNSISAEPGDVIVFNTLNWRRSGFVVLDVNKDQEIVDLSMGQIVPYEVLRTGNNLLHVRFVAQDVPAAGYRRFRLRHAEKPPAAGAFTQSTVLENSYYRVGLDPTNGAVNSIYDKQLQRELVNQQSPYRFGQYLYVSGGDQAPNSILNSGVGPPIKPSLEIHLSAEGHLLSVTRTPYGCVARMQSADTNTPELVTEIRLFDNAKKIEFVEDVDKKAVDTKEATYFAFPFAMKQPQFQYEIQTGVVDPKKDMYPGAGHEWFSLQHWVSVQEDGISAAVMPLDSALVTLGDINRGVWPAGSTSGLEPSSLMP